MVASQLPTGSTGVPRAQASPQLVYAARCSDAEGSVDHPLCSKILWLLCFGTGAPEDPITLPHFLEILGPQEGGNCEASYHIPGYFHSSETQLPRIDPSQRASPTQAPSEDMVQSRLTTPQLNSLLAQRNHESLFKHNLEEGLLKRIARRKFRRRMFGEINSKIVNQFGTACSPFHALATTEIETLTLPSNLPMTSRMMSKGIVCTTESDLKSMQLAFPEFEEELAEEHMPNEKKKPLDQTKKPKLPPLIKPSRSRLSENKKTSGCRLPAVPTVIASTSLKWGKY
ncbi:Cysteine--tRNA ligase [Varanus komodoensis]|nr:Cysteine--tRNA ligase [Varanus komodoensis]